MMLPRQLTSVYHLLHYTILLYFFLSVYPMVLRRDALKDPNYAEMITGEGLVSSYTRETELLTGTIILYAWELYNDLRSLDEAVHRFLVYAKILSIGLSLLCGNKTVAFALVACYGVMALLVPPPRYQGPSNVVDLYQEEFDSDVLKNYDNATAYLVMFYNKWDADSHFLDPIFSQLSIEYANRMHFRSIDAEASPELMRGLLVDDDKGVPQSLPVFIAFYRGEEVQRLPALGDDGKPINSGVKIDKDLLVHHFELKLEPCKISYLKDFSKKSHKKKKH